MEETSPSHPKIPLAIIPNKGITNTQNSS